MQKRARILDPKNMKRLHITRRGRSDISQSNAPSMICVKMVCAWIVMVALDTLTGFRFELLWPTWMMTRAAFDSISMRNQHCVTTIASPTAAKFSVLFVCVTATSDLICYLFIPIRMLIFLATTYVWLNLYCHAQGGFIRTVATLYGGDRSQSWSILSMSMVIVACELFLRIRITKFDYVHFVKSHPILISVLPNVFSVSDWAGVPPVWPLSLNAFFGAHSIGYPVVLITVSLHYYLNEWKLRRKQNDVSNRNEQLFRLLVESLPAEYEGPKDYSSPSQCLEDDVYYLDPPLQPLQAIQSAPPAATPPKKNGVSKTMTSAKNQKKKNGSTPPNDAKSATKKSAKSIRSEENEELEDSEGEDYWRETSDGDQRRGGGIWIIRMFCDAATWAFCMLFARSQSTSLDTSSRRGAADEDDEEEFLGENEFEKRNGRTDSLNSTTKSRTNTMSSVTSSATSSRQNNNNQKHQQKANGRSNQTTTQNHHHHQNAKTNGRSAVRDSSHDTNGSNDQHDRHRELETLRAELASRKSTEEDFRLQISMHESNESRLSQQVSSLKLKVDQVESKCSSLERHRESDKAQLEAAERKYADLLGKKADIEATLSAERKARNESAGKKFDAAEHLRERERQLETEIDKLRAELKSKEEANLRVERELNGLRSYKEENDIDSMKKELASMKSKALQMEESLAGENKLKQSLFKCLGESRTENKIKDQEIAELKSKLKRLQKNEPTTNGHHSATEANNENDTVSTFTASDQSSPHQHSAMGSPVPSTKMPLSVNVCNRGGSPYNEKMSPIAVMSAGPPPPDYMMAVSAPVVVAKNAIRYNEFMHMPTGEHRLFDQPSVAPMSPTPDDELAEKQGTFGAVSKPVTRMA